MRDLPDLETGRNVFLTGYLQLPEPLWELMRWGETGAHPSQAHYLPDEANIRAWVEHVGWQRATLALVQLEVVLECPREVLGAFRGIPMDPNSSYGWVQYIGAWADALCRTLGLPVQPLPTEAEWSGVGTRRRALVAELRKRDAQ